MKSQDYNIRANVIANIIKTATLMILSFVTFPYVCRVLGTITEPNIPGVGENALGLYTWATTFVYYFLTLSRIGLPNIAVRECAKVRDDRKKLSHKAQEFFILQAILTIASFLLMVIIMYSVGGELVDNANLIFILSLNFLLGVFSFEWIYTTLEKHFYLTIRSIIILAVVTVLVFQFITRPEDYFLYAILMVSVTIITTITNLLFINKHISFKKTAPYNFKQYIKPMIVLFIIAILVTIYDKSDTFILGIIDDSKNEVAAYQVGVKAIEIIIGVITSLSMVFTPRASRLIEVEDKTYFKRLTNYAMNIVIFISVPAIITMAALSKPLTNLISGDYQASIYANAPLVLMIIITMILTFSISNLIYTQILIPLKKEKIYMFAMLGGAIINVVLCILLGIYAFPKSPSIGIAIAVIVSDVLIMIFLLIYAWKYVYYAILNWNTLKIFIAGILITISSIFLYPLIDKALLNAMPQNQTLIYSLDIIIVVLIDAVVYLGFLLLTKENLVSSFLRKREEKK